MENIGAVSVTGDKRKSALLTIEVLFISSPKRFANFGDESEHIPFLPEFESLRRAAIAKGSEIHLSPTCSACDRETGDLRTKDPFENPELDRRIPHNLAAMASAKNVSRDERANSAFVQSR